jgi:transcriptional regulator
MGPHAYMSPKVYPDLARVPTWNYVAVHCTVRAEVLDGHAAKDALLKQLIADHEPAYSDQWRGLPEDYTGRMLGAIVAFSLNIISLQCKVKVNQHRPEAHVRMLEIYDAGTPDEQALGQWMRQMGLGA